MTEEVHDIFLLTINNKIEKVVQFTSLTQLDLKRKFFKKANGHNENVWMFRNKS